jgi:hypothetical protein
MADADKLLIYYDDGANQVVELGSTDNAVLDAMVVNLADIESLLTGANFNSTVLAAILGTIDADTDAIKTDIAALEVLSTAANVDLAALEVLSTAANVDLAAIEIDVTSLNTKATTGNVSHAANTSLLATIDADTGAIKTAVEIIDNAIDGNEMQVDIVSSATITVDGTVTADLSATDNAVLDAMVVDLAAMEALLITIDADTNNINLNANAIKDATENSESELVDIKTAVEGTITVDGTVTANLGSTDNAVLDAMVVDLAAIEVLLTSANTDHAANEALLITIDADTNSIKQALESTLDVNVADVSALATHVKQDSIVSLLQLANVDHAANEALLITIDADTNAIKTAVQILDNAISGSEMQVDVVAALPAGTNAIGKLAANSGVDIGDVDVTSTVQPVGHGTVSHVAQNVTDSAVQLGSNACKHVDIMATIANAGTVYIGASGVSATTGIALYPGDVYSVDITNTNLLYTISTVSGDDINMVIYS